MESWALPAFFILLNEYKVSNPQTNSAMKGDIHTHVELKDMAYIDPLTGTTNRHKFNELSKMSLSVQTATRVS